MTKLIALALLAALSAPAAAQDMAMAQAAAPVCPKDAEPIPPALVAWSVKTPLVAATDAAGAGKAVVTPGVAYDLSLATTSAVAFPIGHTRPIPNDTHSGLVRFSIAQTGTYRIAIGAGAWLDVAGTAGPVKSVGHGHGPNCSGIRKMVDFTLQPGDYTLQIVGNPAPALPLLIAKLN